MKNRNEEIENHFVLFEDETTGFVDPDEIDFQDIELFIGKEVPCFYMDENEEVSYDTKEIKEVLYTGTVTV